jgi:hypothetical protein
MEQIAVEEDWEVVRGRDRVVAGAVRADRLRAVLLALVYARNVVIMNHMSEECPARRFIAQSVRQR